MHRIAGSLITIYDAIIDWPDNCPTKRKRASTDGKHRSGSDSKGKARRKTRDYTRISRFLKFGVLLGGGEEIRFHVFRELPSNYLHAASPPTFLLRVCKVLHPFRPEGILTKSMPTRTFLTSHLFHSFDPPSSRDLCNNNNISREHDRFQGEISIEREERREKEEGEEEKAYDDRCFSLEAMQFSSRHCAIHDFVRFVQRTKTFPLRPSIIITRSIRDFLRYAKRYYIRPREISRLNRAKDLLKKRLRILYYEIPRRVCYRVRYNKARCVPV